MSNGFVYRIPQSDVASQLAASITTRYLECSVLASKVIKRYLEILAAAQSTCSNTRLCWFQFLTNFSIVRTITNVFPNMHDFQDVAPVTALLTYQKNNIWDFIWKVHVDHYLLGTGWKPSLPSTKAMWLVLSLHLRRRRLLSINAFSKFRLNNVLK